MNWVYKALFQDLIHRSHRTNPLKGIPMGQDVCIWIVKPKIGRFRRPTGLFFSVA